MLNFPISNISSEKKMYFSQIATLIYSYRHRLSIVKGFRYQFIEEPLGKNANIKIKG
jgi:hypothetical protein